MVSSKLETLNSKQTERLKTKIQKKYFEFFILRFEFI
jgi:hypothetical protein